MTEWIKNKMQQYPAYKRLSLASKTYLDREWRNKQGMSSNGNNNIKAGLAIPFSDFKLLMVKNTKQVIV